MTKLPGHVTDHTSLIHQTSCNIDEFRRKNLAKKSKEDLEKLKMNIISAKDVNSLIGALFDDKDASDALFLMLNDVCLAEVANINSDCGPLSDFPPDINMNVYSNIVEFGLRTCPKTLSFLVNMVTRRAEAVTPSQVLRVATLFASVCHMKNRSLSGLVKLRSLTLQVGGLTDQQLDAMAGLGLAECSRSMCNLRDMLAEVGPQVMLGASAGLPEQSTIDNLDFKSEHMMMEVRTKDDVDTRHMNTEALPKEEALLLFNKQLLLLNLPANTEEREHLATAHSKLLILFCFELS